jgi:hypothetical protein
MRDVVRGKTQKVVQLVGEADYHSGGNPPQTFTKYGLYGSDLGTPLDFGPSGSFRTTREDQLRRAPHRGLWFLFGDAWTAVRRDDGLLEPKIADNGLPLDDNSALTPPYNKYHPFNADPVGIAPPNVTAENLDNTFELTFFVAPDPDRDQGYATLEVPGVNLLTNKVPTGAICTPSGDVYVFVTGKPFQIGGDPALIADAIVAARDAVVSVGGDGDQYSWVARWSDLTTLKTEPPYLFSTGHFANYLVPVIGGVADGTGTPAHPTDGEVVWLWGTGFPNRQSSVRLAYVPLRRVSDRAAWRFFRRTKSGDSWVKDEAEATPLFNCPSVGEFSVAWNKYLGLWLMLYGCSDPRGILCRWAAKPWGPWSEGIILFDPWTDGGYGYFMHAADREDGLEDFGRGGVWGGEYAPIIIPRYTLGSGKTTKIRYTMSTWNPYTAVIMESELRRRDWRDEIFVTVIRAWQNAFTQGQRWLANRLRPWRS